MNLPAEQPQSSPSTAPASEPDIDPRISAFLARQPTLLHSRESWARQQVLDHLSDLFKDAMRPLEEMEQRSYLGLFRSLVAAKGALDAESKGFVEAFEQAGLQALRTRIKQDCGQDLDPRTTYLHTAYAVDPGKKRRAAPQRRALDPSAGVAVDVATLSLWQAACLNFAFFDFPEMKRRWISYGTGEEDINLGSLIDVDTFIHIVRELNLGADLRQRVDTALQPLALLPRLIHGYVHELFRFNLYEATRDVAKTRMSRGMFESLRDALERGTPWLKVEQVAIQLPQSLARRMARVELSIADALLRLFSLKSFDLSGIYLPALILRVSGEPGLYSYCAERPDGVLRHHVSLAAFEEEFKALLKADNSREALGWLISSLAFEQQSKLWQLIEPEHKPTQLNWLADKLYDAFHWVFPNHTVDDLGFAYHPAGASPEQALSTFYSWRFRLNTEAIAVPKGQQDLRAVKEGIVSLMHQLLDLLLTPVPGGLGSLGRVVMAAMAGHLTLELFDGIEGAGEGHPQALLQAGLETANMLLLAGLHGYAGRLAYRHIGQEFKRLDKYRRVQLADGASQLWQPTLLPYARKSVELSALFDEQGLSPLGGKLYGQVKERGQDLTVELEYDKTLKGYRATHPDAGQFHPPMLYDPASRRWSVSLDDSHQLSDARLLQRMIALKGADQEQAQQILDISGVSREHLEQIWSGGVPQASLVEALERFEVDRGIAELRAGDQELALLSPCAQRALFSLLPELRDWPADLCLKVHAADGELQQAYGQRQRLELYTHSVSIRRLEDGSFIEQTEVPSDSSVATARGYEPGVLALILSLLPSDSLLRGGSDPLVWRVWSKTVRRLVNALARERSGPLFEALGTHAGRIKVDVSDNAFGAEVGAYLPVLTSGVPALPGKIRQLYPQLSLARLAQFLRDNPLSSSQCQILLDNNRLPYRLGYNLAHTQQLSTLGRALDGIYQARAFQEDTDAWLQAIAVGVVSERLGRALKWVDSDRAFLPAPGDLPLRRYGQGLYTALDSRRQPSLDLSSPAESFYLAFAASLSTRELGLLGMVSAADVQALRNALGAGLGALRRPDGSVGLALELYECPALSEGYREPDSPGLYVKDGVRFVCLDQRFYQVEQDLRFDEWRIGHPWLKGAYAPLLEHNDRGGWWHEFENPLAWDGPTAFRRLEPGAAVFSASVARQILAISAVDDALPGRLLFENQPSAPLLSEVARRFLQARMDSPLLEVAECDPGSDLQVSFLRQQFPRLSVDMAQDLTEQADSSQRQLMRDYKRVPLALAEEARYLSREIEVCRVYESLFLSTTRNDACDTLLLQLLERLPGWSRTLRIELRRETTTGPLIASVGEVSAAVRRILVKTERGYEPFESDSSGPRSLAALDDDPFAALLQALPQLKRTTLDLLHGGDDVEMDLKRLMFQSVAGDRNRIRQLLGQPPVLPWSRPPQRLMRLESGVLGYPLSGRGRSGLYPSELFKPLKKLYRGCSDAQIAEILANLGATFEARVRAVEHLQDEYRQLKDDLARWQYAPQFEEMDLPFSDSRIPRRRKIARRLRHCWRRQSIAQDLGPLRYELVLDGLEIEDLPELSADFSHVALLSMNDMRLGNARYLSRFLRYFSGLTTLRMDGNGLSSLPNAIGTLERLEELSLENNQLKLTQGTARELAGLTRLQRLNLNGNPLGVLPYFGEMEQLQVLRLSRTGIERWPLGLLALRDLVRVELRENAISELPVELFSRHAQLCRGLDLSGNPLSAQVLRSIRHYRQTVENHDVVFGLGRLRLSSLFGIDRWADGAEKTAQRSAQWQSVRDQPNADVFFLLLDRMSSPPNFFHDEYQPVRSDLSARVWRLIKAASEDRALCEEVFRLEAQGRVVGLTSYQIFNRLELSVDCHEALRLTDQEAVESRLLSVLRGQFRLGVLSVAVGRKHPARSLFWYRAYYDALAAELALPSQFNGLFTANPVHVGKQQASDIKAEVLREELPQALPEGSPGKSPEARLETLLEGMSEALPEEIPQEPPGVLPDELPPEPHEESADAESLPLIGYLVANDSWSDFLIRAHERDFRRVFGRLWEFDKRLEDSEYRHLWRTRLNQLQYTRRRAAWLRHWTVKALGKVGVSPLGSA